MVTPEELDMIQQWRASGKTAAPPAAAIARELAKGLLFTKGEPHVAGTSEACHTNTAPVGAAGAGQHAAQQGQASTALEQQPGHE